MNTLECIFSRRSIRKYDPAKAVPDEVMDTILKAACSAPSACDRRPWEFVVVKDKGMIQKIAQVSEYYAPLHTATAVIVVLLEQKTAKVEYNHHDCAAATQNILLAAKAQGIGTCWCGALLEDSALKQLKDLLSIPRKIIPFSVISLGYPAEEKEPKGQIQESKIHYEKY